MLNPNPRTCCLYSVYISLCVCCWYIVCVQTVCLNPTAVCCGAFLRALVRVLLASEYSSWMALIRPAGGDNTHGMDLK